MMNELVSVVIPTHNRGMMIQRALDSLINQSYPHIEIIVVNDGSSDNTEKIILELQNSHANIVYLRHNTPQGAPSSRNYGIQNARGKYLTFLDDDDEMLPTKIELMVKLFKHEMGLIASGYYQISSKEKKKIIPHYDISYCDLLFSYKLGGGNQMMTLTERAKTVGGFDEALAAFQDYDFWLRISQKFGSIYCIQEPLSIIHTEHEEDRITTSNKRFHGALLFYNKHKKEMSSSQRKFQLFHLMRLRNKHIGFKQYLNMVPLEFIPSTYRYYLAKNYPIFGWLKRQILN